MGVNSIQENANETIDLFVLGRLCLFGEHSDWAGLNKSMNSSIVSGCAVVTGIEQGIYGKVSKSHNFSVTSALSEYHGASFECEMDMGILRSTAKEGGFFSYVSGVASYMCEWYHVSGMHLDMLTGILRDEWGFDGMVTTDWWTYGEHYKEVMAGNDMKMAVGYPERLLDAKEKGVLTREAMETAAKNVLTLILRID